MKHHVLLTGLFTSFLIASCSFSAPEPTVTPAPPTDTATPNPTSTPTIVPTATLVNVNVQVKDSLINCRFGPGIGYALVNEIQQGVSARAVGRNEASTWLYIRDPGNPNGTCWVSASVMDAQGAVDQLTVVNPPIVTVTDVRLRLEPTRIVVDCYQFPQTVFFEAQVTVNGPTYISWRWEASTGVASKDELIVFEGASTKTLNGHYQVDAPNEYWLQIHILAPNESITQVTFPASCTP